MAKESNCDFINCTLAANTAINYGACLYNDSSDVFFNRCILWDLPTDGITEYGTASTTAAYSDIQQDSGVFPGTGNINVDPQFTTGTWGDYYLNAVSPSVSPCIDAGDVAASTVCYCAGTLQLCLGDLTTNIDDSPDTGLADLGFHYYQQVLYLPSVSPAGIAVLLLVVGLIIFRSRR